MKNNIRLTFLLSVFLLGGAFSLHAKQARPSPAANEVTALSKRVATLEAQLRNVEADLKISLSDIKTELAALRKELKTVKNQKCPETTELADKFQGFQKELTNSKELQNILVKYGNNSEGMPALHYAIKQGDINTVNLLIANGADVNSKDRNHTALTRAVSCNQYQIAEILLTYGADANLSGFPQGWTNKTDCSYSVYEEDNYYPIYYATKSGSVDLISLLLKNGAKLDRVIDRKLYKYPVTPLHIACESGHYDAVVILINNGAEINGSCPLQEERKGELVWRDGTPLDWAFYKLKYKDNPQNLELIKLLVEHGATRLVTPISGRVCTGLWDPCPVISKYLKGVGLSDY